MDENKAPELRRFKEFLDGMPYEQLDKIESDVRKFATASLEVGAYLSIVEAVLKAFNHKIGEHDEKTR